MTQLTTRKRSVSALTVLAASVLLADLVTVTALRDDDVVPAPRALARPATTSTATATTAATATAAPRVVTSSAAPAATAATAAPAAPAATAPSRTSRSTPARAVPTTSPLATSTPTTSPTPTAASVPRTAPLVTDTRLSWKPPTLATGYVTRQVKQGERILKLDPTKDHVLRLPTDNPLLVDGDFQIVGGRNVVLIGGEVRNRVGGRHLFIRGTEGVTRTRTVHVEGVRFTGSYGITMTEGVNIDAQGEPGLTVRLQNVQVSRVVGSYSGKHADIIQNWNGPYALQLDRFVGETTYQGVMHQPNLYGDGPYGQSVFRRVWFNGPTSGSMLWYKDQDGQPPVALDRFFVTPNPDKVYPSQAFYGLSHRASEFTRLSPGAKPPIAILTGNPGVGYVSPGY